MNRKIYALTVFVVLLTGCKSVEPTKPQPTEWPQTCEMCGAEWLVTPIENPDEQVPPTVEWCFHDGAYCGEGLDMIIKSETEGGSEDLERQFLNHCLSCKGCRCAAFSPDEWNKIIETIKQIQN